MAPVTTKEMTERIDALNKQFGEMVDSIRRLFEQQNNNVTLISRLSDDLADLKTELVRVKNGMTKQEESSVTKYV